MVNYLDSRRIMGTTAERSSIPVPATTGGWVEVGRTTLGEASSTIDVTSLPDKRYYMVLAYCDRDLVATNTAMRMGNGSFDSGANYSNRYSSDGAADATNTSQTSMFGQLVADTNPNFSVGYLTNHSASEKLWMNWVVHQRTAGATTAPTRREIYSKHAFTSNPIDQLQFATLNSNEFQSGDEIVVLGWDPADTHTNNFWEELASVELGSSNATIDSGTITAKKYLWFQVYVTGKSTSTKPNMQFNSDTASNYARRFSVNGGADTTEAPRANIMLHETNDSNPTFVNGFIINNQSNEKLYLGHAINQNTAGAGTAPDRCESIGKWANTSNQITSIQVNANSGTFGTGSILKVWGAD